MGQTLETIWQYRRMFLRPTYRKVGMLGVPYYAIFECLAPLFQILSIATLALAGIYGILGWQPYLAFLGMMAFGTAIPTTLSVWLHDKGYRDYRVRDLVHMLLLGPVDPGPMGDGRPVDVEPRGTGHDPKVGPGRRTV